MREQNGTHVSTKPRRNRQASSNKTMLQRPANDDEDAWKAYWKTQGQPWRWEPEISQERLGHSTIMMTLEIYSHILPSMQQEVAEKIDDMCKNF